MLYIKGKVNAVSLKTPEGEFKPFYNVQFIKETEQGTLIQTWCRVYSDSPIKVKDELEIQVKVSTWIGKNGKANYQLIGFNK